MKIRDGLVLIAWGLLFGIFMTLAGAGIFAISDSVVSKSVVPQGETGDWIGWILPWFAIDVGPALYCASQVTAELYLCGAILPVSHIWGNFGTNVILFAAVFMIYKIVRRKRASSVDNRTREEEQ